MLFFEGFREEICPRNNFAAARRGLPARVSKAQRNRIIFALPRLRNRHEAPRFKINPPNEPSTPPESLMPPRGFGPRSSAALYGVDAISNWLIPRFLFRSLLRGVCVPRGLADTRSCGLGLRACGRAEQMRCRFICEDEGKYSYAWVYV